MNGEPLRRVFTVTNPQGLHMRPITDFVKAAEQFRSDISLAREGTDKINGKSALSLLTLAAEQGTVLILEASGPDAEQAMNALLEVLARTYED